MKKNRKKQNNKGFSLVELIIVIAIMAILVGAIAPQVYAYVEKSRRAKDMMMIDTIYTTVQTAIADLPSEPDTFSGEITVALSKVSTLSALLSDDIDTTAEIQGKAKSKLGKAGVLNVDYNNTTGALSVYIVDGTNKLGPVTN